MVAHWVVLLVDLMVEHWVEMMVDRSELPMAGD